MTTVLSAVLSGGSRKSFSDLAGIAERPLSTTFAVSANYGFNISYVCMLLSQPGWTVDTVIGRYFLKHHGVILVTIIPNR